MPNITTNHTITYTNISINMDTQFQQYMNIIVSDVGLVHPRRPILAPCGTQLVYVKDARKVVLTFDSVDKILYTGLKNGFAQIFSLQIRPKFKIWGKDSKYHICRPKNRGFK